MIGFQSPESSPDWESQTNLVKFPRRKRSNVKKRILIVDDVEDIRLMLRLKIANTFPQMQIVEAASGMMASVELAKSSFDLVISDMNMANGDGLWLHFFIEQCHADTPLVFFVCSPERIPSAVGTRKVFAKTEANGLLNELLVRWGTNEAE